MELRFLHTEEVPTPFTVSFLEDIAKRTLEIVPIEGLAEKIIELSVAAVSPERIQELNSTYRGKDAVTDILSFPEHTSLLEGEKLPEGDLVIGDLVYSPSYIETAAQEDELPAFHEMAYVFSHGVLHLLGYDHSEEMFALQDRVTEAIVRDTLR